MRAMQILSAVGCSIAVTISLAENAPPKLTAVSEPPPAVTAALESVANLCREVGGTPMTVDAVKRVDLNVDGTDDYILDVGAINCDGAASVYGDREKSVMVYVGDEAGGATEAFSDAVFGARIDGTGAAAKLWLTVSGKQCGKKPAVDFANEEFCDRALVWNAKT
ncbi:MAG: hypothetical protein ACREXT_05520, partial [Gammaproteobacteria bacterium]